MHRQRYWNLPIVQYEQWIENLNSRDDTLPTYNVRSRFNRYEFILNWTIEVLLQSVFINDNIAFQFPMLFAKAPKDKVKYECIGTALGFFETFLEGENYIAGKNLTLADLTLAVTMSTYEVIFPDKFNRIISCMKIQIDDLSIINYE